MPTAPSVTLIGAERLDHTLEYLINHASPKALRSGLGAALTVMRKEFRRQVNQTTLDTEHASDVKAAARKLIGSRFGRKRSRGAYEAKVGFAVGIRGAKRLLRMSKGTSTHPKQVGITAQNIHWFVLGARGKRYGVMPDFFEGVAQRALMNSGDAALAAARAKIARVMALEAKKR